MKRGSEKETVNNQGQMQKGLAFLRQGIEDLSSAICLNAGEHPVSTEITIDLDRISRLLHGIDKTEIGIGHIEKALEALKAINAKQIQLAQIAANETTTLQERFKLASELEKSAKEVNQMLKY